MATKDEGLFWLFSQRQSFRELPNHEDYNSYLKSILICANGDGTLAPEERDWVVGFASAFGAPDSLVEELKSYKADEDIEKMISNTPSANASRRFLVHDAIMACSADGAYSDLERATITKMAAKLGISQDTVEQIERICIEEIELREKRVKLVYPEGPPL
jgi:tellurite resistance protein